MDSQGHLRSEPACDKHDRTVAGRLQYKRSQPLNSVPVNIERAEDVTLVTEVKIRSGYFSFDERNEEEVIKTSRSYSAPFNAHVLEKADNRQDGDSFSFPENFYPLLHKMLTTKQDWTRRLSYKGCATFEAGVIEWTENILREFKKPLKQAEIYGAVGVSSYPYHYSDNIWKAFLELWGPLTNTLHHGNGEMSISLYDMKVIGGLPILGSPYEEFIPENKVIHKHYPPTVAELLWIYSQLCEANKKDSVFCEEWFSHFYRGRLLYTAYGEDMKPIKYLQPRRPQASKLDLKVSLEGELAAFLVFWLNRFVLPSYSRRIRPETVYMACLMAQGTRVSLAPAVLGTIYHSLGEIATHSKGPGESKSCFPIHYVIGWLGEYFPRLNIRRTKDEYDIDYPCLIRYAGSLSQDLDITSARRVFRTDDSVIYRPNPFFEEEGHYLIDNEDLTEKQFELLICLRSGLLPGRMGDQRWLEPYYPNRFARQFGFDQGLPSNKLQFGIGRRNRCRIEEMARAQARLLRVGTGTRFYIPRSTYLGYCTWPYCRWWMRACAPYLGRSVTYVYKTLKKPLHEKKENVYVIKSLKDMSYTLPPENQKKRLSFHDTSSESSPAVDETRIYKRFRRENHHNSRNKANDDFMIASHDDDIAENVPVSTPVLKSVVTFSESDLETAKLNLEDSMSFLQEDQIITPNAPPSPRSGETNAHVKDTSPTSSGATVLVGSDDEGGIQQENITSLPNTFDLEVYERRKKFVAAELDILLSKLSLSPKEFLPDRETILESLDMLKPIMKRLGADEAKFESFTEKVKEALDLATQLSHSMNDVNDPAILNDEHIQDLIRKQEECRTAEKAIALKLSDLKSRHTTLLASEEGIKKEEERIQQMRMAFESQNRDFVAEIKDVVKSSEEKRKLAVELSQARVKAEEEKLQDLEKIKDSNKAQEKELADMMESLKSYRDSV